MIIWEITGAFFGGVTVGVWAAMRASAGAYARGVRDAFYTVAAFLREQGADDFAAMVEHAAQADKGDR